MGDAHYKLIRPATALATWVERGARFFSYSFDGAMLLDGAHQAVCQTRDVVGARLL